MIANRSATQINIKKTLLDTVRLVLRNCGFSAFPGEDGTIANLLLKRMVVQVLLPCTRNIGIGMFTACSRKLKWYRGGKASGKQTRRHQQVISPCHLGLASTLSCANQAGRSSGDYQGWQNARLSVPSMERGGFGNPPNHATTCWCGCYHWWRKENCPIVSDLGRPSTWTYTHRLKPSNLCTRIICAYSPWWAFCGSQSQLKLKRSPKTCLTNVI